MKAHKSRKKVDTNDARPRAGRDAVAKGSDDLAAAAERCPSKTYFRYPAAARRREPVRFYR